jgi:hypothetical protein
VTEMPDQPDQIDLIEWATELERERARVAATNAERARRRGFLVFATDPTVDPDSPGYREVYATEADTPAKAVAKVRPLAHGRRLRAYLATGHYSDQLPEARWVA